MPSSIRVVFCAAVPSSSILIDPRRLGSVPSSKTVTPGAAIRCPISPAKALLPLRLKSPSSPCPMASCSKIPGHPGPNTTSIIPAGAAIASRLTAAIRKASRALGCQSSGWINSEREKRPPPPALPLSRRPLFSKITEILTRLMGRRSVKISPSGRIITTSCKLAAITALTCTTRLSKARR